MVDQRRFDLDGADAVAGDVHHVIHAAQQPEVAVLITSGAIASEVHALEAAPVRGLVALRITVDAAEHARPRALEHEIAAPAGSDLVALLVDDPATTDLERADAMESLAQMDLMHGSGEEAEALLTRFSLIDWAEELIESYSHGMKQRLIMSAAFLHDPELIIVDEPLVGLDPEGIKMVRDLFRRSAQAGKTVFMSTHTLKVAEDVCDRIGIINKGRLIALGSIDELRQQAEADKADLEAVFLKLTRTPP